MVAVVDGKDRDFLVAGRRQQEFGTVLGGGDTPGNGAVFALALPLDETCRRS